MSHVVTEKCLKCKYTDCVEVCPVDCFHEAEEFLVIDPEVCIDCGVCVPECPVEAIISDETHIEGKSLEDIIATSDLSSLTEGQRNAKFMVSFNEKSSQELPTIVARKEPLPEAEKWSGVTDKIRYVMDLESKGNDV